MNGRVRAHVVAVAVALALAGTAHAQDADVATEARQQYQMGTQAFQGKRYSEAALHFEAAAAFRVSAVALYTAGLAWDLAGKPERAADAYARALDAPGLDAKQGNVAKERIASLERTLGTLAVITPDGYRVQLDALTEVPSPARLHGVAGAHVLSIRAPGRTIERRDVTLDAGRLLPVEIKDEPKPTAKPPTKIEPTPSASTEAPMPPPRLETFWIPRRVAGVGVAGVGVAALGAGIVLGLQANDARDAYNAAPTRPGFDHASAMQTWTNVAFISGLLLLAGGATLVLFPDRDKEARFHASAVPLPGGGAAALGGSL